MPKNISNTDSGGSGGVFPQILVNTFAAKLNSSSTGFLVYNSTPTDLLFKIDGSGASPTATFYCDINVLGSASFTSVSNIEVTASMMSLATGNTSSDLIDIGFYGLYNSSGNKYRGLVKSTSLGRWVLFKDITSAPSTTVSLSGSWRDTLELQDLYFNGDGSTLSALKTDVDLFPDALQSLTTAEINQLQNINSNTISSTQWGYIAASDQVTNTTSIPTFSKLILGAGTVSAPAIIFGDTTTGIYRNTSNQVGISISGTLITYWSSTGMVVNSGVLSVPAGTANAPTINFGIANTGFYQPSSSQVGVSISASNLITWNSTGETLASGALRVPNGSVGTPSINLGSTTTGFYQPASNQIGISVSGANIGTWSSTGLAMNTLAISGISTASGDTASFTTLTGTLSTASQPNVTTMAGLTSIGTTGQSLSIAGATITSTQWLNYILTLNQNVSTTGNPAFTALIVTTGQFLAADGSDTAPSISFANNNTTGFFYGSGYVGVTANSTFVASFSSSTVGFYTDVITGKKISIGSPLFTNETYIIRATAISTVNTNTVTLNSVQSIARFNLASATSGYSQRQFYANFDNNTIGIGGDMDQMVGFYCDSFSNLTNNGILTTACSAYFKTQSIADTNNCAVFTEDLVVGNAIGTPPTFGAMISGDTLIGTTTNPSSRKLLVNGAIESSTGGIYGTLMTAAQTNITSVGSLTGLTMAGSIDLNTNNISNGGTISGTSLGGTLTTASQPNITSLDGLTTIQGQSIATTAWFYVNGLNQSLGTTGGPSFTKITLTGTTNSLPSTLNFTYTAGALNLTGPQYTVSGNRRWAWYIQTAETGSNAGSNLSLATYSDAGGLLADCLTLTRSNCRVQTGASTVIGSNSALATNATSGFLYIPTCAGTPTGVPGAETGKSAIVYDTTNNRLYAYNGAWRSVVLA